MKRLSLLGTSVNLRHIDDAVRILRDGGVIIYPTDTVYALGCDALNSKAIQRLCRLKGINPDRQQLSIICSSFSQAAEYAKIDNRSFRLMKEYLPGPYTFILPASGSLPKIFKGRKSVGVRIPDNAVACALAENLGNPLLTTSADIDISTGDLQADALEAAYRHDADLLLDAGDIGLELSTVVDCLDSSSPSVVRQGAGEFA